MIIPPKQLLITSAALMLMAVEPLLAVEEAPFNLVQQEGDFEIRDYAPSVVAEVVVSGDFEDAGSSAFKKLFKYIGGENQATDEIAMTSPVSQEATPDGWAVSFMMPASYTMETIPQPNDTVVKVREIPAYRAAAIRYSGTWSEKKYREHLEKLQQWMKDSGIRAAGEPVWARYNAPFVPWFMRRNEILIPIQGS